MKFEQISMTLLLVSALGLAGGAITATVVGEEVTYMRGIGTGLFFAGLILGAYGRWTMATAAFKHSTNWGFMVIFVPLAETVFLIQHFKQARFPALLQLVGFFYVIIGMIMIFFGAPKKLGVAAEEIVFSVESLIQVLAV